MSNGGYSVARIAAFCKVLALLPYEGRGPLLYRVRSDNESHERIVPSRPVARIERSALLCRWKGRIQAGYASLPLALSDTGSSGF